MVNFLLDVILLFQDRGKIEIFGIGKYRLTNKTEKARIKYIYWYISIKLFHNRRTDNYT